MPFSGLAFLGSLPEIGCTEWSLSPSQSAPWGGKCSCPSRRWWQVSWGSLALWGCSLCPIMGSGSGGRDVPFLSLVPCGVPPAHTSSAIGIPFGEGGLLPEGG